MKKLIFSSLILILTFNQCGLKHKEKESKIKLYFNILNKVDNKNNNNEYVYYSAEIKLVNNTDSIFKFWTMTCSWPENFVFSFDSTYVPFDTLDIYLGHSCQSNYSIIHQIKPKDKITIKTVIRYIGSNNYLIEKKIRLGFIIIKEKELSKLGEEFFEELIKKRKNRKDIIWSEPFKIVQ